MEVKELNLKDWHLRATGTPTLTERMVRTARMMASFRDLELKFVTEPGSVVLCQEELNLVINVVLTGLSVMRDILDYGSLVICSQGLDGEVTWLLKANLCNGPSIVPANSVIEREKRNEKQETRPSREETVNIIQDILNHGRGVEQKALRRLDLPEGSELGSCIYVEKDVDIETAYALVANSDHGRYIATFIGCRMYVPDFYPLAMVMQTLACLRGDDIKLQEAANLVTRGLNDRQYEVAVKLMDDIAQTFDSGRDPMLNEWLEWRKSFKEER